MDRAACQRFSVSGTRCAQAPSYLFGPSLNANFGVKEQRLLVAVEGLWQVSLGVDAHSTQLHGPRPRFAVYFGYGWEHPINDFGQSFR